MLDQQAVQEMLACITSLACKKLFLKKLLVYHYRLKFQEFHEKYITTLWVMMLSIEQNNDEAIPSQEFK